ncbi:MAG: SH3 domain-containing protein, partial [Anaerolineae bacterium]|nr:SH3 domain-containing protein [Anaerolineae bacterium]
MNRKKRTWLAFLATALGITVLLASCTGTSSEPEQPAVPVAKITSPEANNNLPVDQDILVTFNAADIKGIAQVELSINGEAVMVETVSPPVNSYTASYRWRPTQAGTQVIELTAFNIEQTASQPDQVIVTVIGGGTSTINPTTEPLPTEAAVEATPTTTGGDSPIPTATSIPFATPTVAPLESADNQPRVTMLTGLNVRQGPGTNYPIIGRLTQNDSAVITGRNEFSGWWQIEFDSDAGNRGWVAASAEFSQATNADNVPVVAGPSLEDIPAPTAPAASQKPTIFSFTADRYTIAPDESVTLKWDLENA